MKTNNNRFIGFFFIVFLTAFLSGCSGLPDLLMHEFKLMPKRLTDNKALIKTKKEAFDKLSSHDEWKFFSPYLDAGKWVDKFDIAKDELSKAKKLYDTQIEPMADRNEPEETQAFSKLIDQFKKHMHTSIEAANYVDKRIVFLVTSRNTADEMYKKASQQYGNNESLQRRFTSKANAATAKYPNKKDDLAKRVSGLDTLVDENNDSYAMLKTEYHKNTSTNYARFGDAAVALNKTSENVAKYENEHSMKVDELYRSYVKVLADQRVDYYVVIGRATWCEGEFCGSGSESHFPAATVDAKIFEYFDTLTLNTIAKYRQSWGGNDKFTLKIPQDKWNALRLNYKSGKSRGHDYGEYWVENTYSKTYHKYIEIVNDKMTEKAWQSVSEDYFWARYEDLGMAIMTKPYGYYEEDSLKDAQPAGMATVAKPVMRNGAATGSNQYGEWRYSNGNSFWYYYGTYRLFSALAGPRRYSYNDWNSYSGRRSGYGYYGRNYEYGTYGSSTYSNTRYRNSSYATRNPGEVRSAVSGKSRSSRSNPSVRGGGSSSRSRGPSGGGK